MTVYAQKITTPALTDTKIPIQENPKYVCTGYIVTDVVGNLTYKILDEQGDETEALTIQGPMVWRFQYCNYQALIINPLNAGTTHVVITNVFPYPDVPGAKVVVDPPGYTATETQVPAYLINQLWPDLIPAGPAGGGAMAPFDKTEPSASIGAGATVVLDTIVGAGLAILVNDGTGDPLINVQYIIDGGAPVTWVTADVNAIVAVTFNTSLVFRVVNTDGVLAHNSANTSDTGLAS